MNSRGTDSYRRGDKMYCVLGGTLYSHLNLGEPAGRSGHNPPWVVINKTIEIGFLRDRVGDWESLGRVPVFLVRVRSPGSVGLSVCLSASTISFFRPRLID